MSSVSTLALPLPASAEKLTFVDQKNPKLRDMKIPLVVGIEHVTNYLLQIPPAALSRVQVLEQGTHGVSVGRVRAMLKSRAWALQRSAQ